MMAGKASVQTYIASTSAEHLSVCLCVKAAAACVRHAFQCWWVRVRSMRCLHFHLCCWNSPGLRLLHVCAGIMLCTDLQTSSAACVKGGLWDVLRVCHRGARQRGWQRFSKKIEKKQLRFWFLTIKVSLSFLTVGNSLHDISLYCWLFRIWTAVCAWKFKYFVARLSAYCQICVIWDVIKNTKLIFLLMMSVSCEM